MHCKVKKNVWLATFTQIAIFLFSLITYHEFSILGYINISFYITSALLLTSLLLYTIQRGFYDVIGKSFNLAFSRDKQRKFDDVPALSEMITLNNKPLLFNGLVTGGLMVIALVVYYV